MIEDALGERHGRAGRGRGAFNRRLPKPALNGSARRRATPRPTTPRRGALRHRLRFDPSLPTSRRSPDQQAELQGAATRDGLATSGRGLTRGRAGMNERARRTERVVVTVEGQRARVLSFDDSRVNVYLPGADSRGRALCRVWVDGTSPRPKTCRCEREPRLFTSTPGAGGPLRAASGCVNGGRAAGALDGAPRPSPLGTGWRNSLPVTRTVGGRAARSSLPARRVPASIKSSALPDARRRGRWRRRHDGRRRDEPRGRDRHGQVSFRDRGESGRGQLPSRQTATPRDPLRGSRRRRCFRSRRARGLQVGAEPPAISGVHEAATITRGGELRGGLMA